MTLNRINGTLSIPAHTETQTHRRNSCVWCMYQLAHESEKLACSRYDKITQKKTFEKLWRWARVVEYTNVKWLLRCRLDSPVRSTIILLEVQRALS